jgi:Chitobiase/beta-hexosaminidase C-terminal domain
VATSTFSPVAGTYTGAQTITLSNTNSGLGGFAQYYTTDGSTPTTGSTQYSSPFSLPDSATVKVLAVATGYINSAIGSAAYTIQWTVSGNAGVASATVSYTGTSSGSTTADGSGNYTITVGDGSYTITPSLTGWTFSPTNRSETVSGANITGVNFTATQIQVTTSTFSPAPGTFQTGQTITLLNADSALAGFAMYYTTDNSTPTTGSTLYTVPFAIHHTTVVKVLAVVTGYANSAIAVGVFIILTGTGDGLWVDYRFRY